MHFHNMRNECTILDSCIAYAKLPIPDKDKKCLVAHANIGREIVIDQSGCIFFNR